MTSPIRVGALLFEGFELLDFFGPREMFGLLDDDARITVVAGKAGPVKAAVDHAAWLTQQWGNAPGSMCFLSRAGSGPGKP